MSGMTPHLPSGLGMVELREIIQRLKDKYTFACQRRSDRRVFDNLQLEFRQAREPDQWRKAVCRAADKMDFAWIALKTTKGDGRLKERLWHPPSGKPNVSRVLTMTIPFRNGHDPKTSQQLEVAICINGSLEAAGHRATLFGRLIDESRLRLAAALPDHGLSGQS